jgi:hypothetical protein
VSHRSAFSALSEEEARKTWESWTKSSEEKKKRDRSRSRSPSRKDSRSTKRGHDDKGGVEEGEVK